MAKRRRKPEDIEEEEPIKERPPRRKRRFLFRLVVLGLLLLAAIGVAPLIIANSPLRDMLLNWQMPVGGWRIECQQAGLSWVGSQKLMNAAIIDPSGNPLATVEGLAVERSLLRLAVQSNNLGTIRLVKPTFYVAPRTDGSNIEDFLAALEKQQSSASGSGTPGAKAPPIVDIEVVEGTLKGIDSATGMQWEVNQINLTTSHDANGQGSADGTATIAGRGTESAGRVKFRVVPSEKGDQQLDLLAEGLMLEPLAPWLARLIGECKLAGTTGLDAHATWSRAPDASLIINTWGRSETNDLALTGAVLKGDELKCEKLVIPWKVSVSGDSISAEQLQVNFGWADVEARGAISMSDLKNVGLANLPKRELQVTGKASLAQLAKMLPHALQVREGVRIDSGDVEFSAHSGDENGKFAWKAEGSLSNLVGQDQGRLIQWKEPLKLSANWIESEKGPRLDRVTLAAPFARGDFTTTADRIDGEFQLDLAELTEELGQFVDLKGMTARGSALGKLTLTSSAGDAFAAAADVTLRDLVVTQQGKPLWEEPQLIVKLEAVGSAADLNPKSISTGSLQLRGARDALNVKLTAPVDLTAPTTWAMDVDGTGPLDSWAGRLRPWSNAIPDEVTGDAAIKSKLTVGADSARVTDLAGSVNQLHVRGTRVAVDEPHVEFSGDCEWDSKGKKLASSQFQLASSVIAFRSRDLRFEFAPSSVPVMTGDLAFRADLERLSGAAGLVGGRDASWPRGSASGVMRFATNSAQVLTDFTFDAEQLQLVKSTKGSPPTVIWAEPSLHSAGKAIYSIADERATIENLRVDGQSLQLAGLAAWDKPLANGPIALSGKVQYDPRTVSSLIAGYLGPNVIVEGDRSVQFELRGQLPATGAKTHWSRTWQAKAEAGWTQAGVFGLPISAGKLQGTLADGKLQTAPLDLSVGSGRLTANPLAILDPAPQKIVLPQGPLIANVEISPAVSEQILKYVAPVLAGATRIDGRFSVDLAPSEIPIADPKLMQLMGKVSVHQLNVLPGPLVADLANLIQQMKSLKNPEKLLAVGSTAPKQSKLLTMADQQIDFQVAQGRVYHRNLQFVVDDVPITSRGSVGFDQTLALEITIPIQDRWIDGEDALRGLAGQSLKVPVEGTFQKPRIDERAIADVTKQVLRSTAREAIGGEINRQLEKLFQGK